MLLATRSLHMALDSLSRTLTLAHLGFSGLQLLTQIIIADITTLRWRGLVSGLVSMPFLVNGFIGSNVYSSVYEHSGWRWGYGMFAILVPASLSPLIITLAWAQRKAKKMGLLGDSRVDELGRSPIMVAKDFAEDLDAVGLLLLAGGWACLLVPIALAASTPHKFASGSMIAMLVIGPILLIAFIFWELRFAKEPVVAWRFLRNRNIVGATLIGFFDFVSFYISYLYLYSFIVVTKPWSLTNLGYLSITQSVALTFFGICCGVIMAYLRIWKVLLIVGLSIRLLDAGVMIHSRGAQGSTGELVINQVLQGMGGGIAATVVQVAAQGSVTHLDVATVTAIVLLITELGTSIGNTIAGGVWANQMPDYLERYLPVSVNATERATLFGSITLIASYPIDDPVRLGAIEAYEAVMRNLTIAATCVAIIPLLLAIFVMRDYRLNDRQNAVDDSTLDGKLGDKESFQQADIGACVDNENGESHSA
ncbi:hypothetical protein FRB94_008156 [Tulasnella sp. JGI-2019a]|nr:hypothetical protein FRB94_008156 [Tulasnella sp. JGI-2019a]